MRVRNVVRVGDELFVRDCGDHGWSMVGTGSARYALAAAALCLITAGCTSTSSGSAGPVSPAGSAAGARPPAAVTRIVDRIAARAVRAGVGLSVAVESHGQLCARLWAGRCSPGPPCDPGDGVSGCVTDQAVHGRRDHATRAAAPVAAAGHGRRPVAGYPVGRSAGPACHRAGAVDSYLGDPRLYQRPSLRPARKPAAKQPHPFCG